MSESDLGRLSDALLGFVKERDWEQFHSPKNLSMAICVEAAELAEHFIWTDAREPMKLAPEDLNRVALEWQTFSFIRCGCHRSWASI